MSEPVLLPIPEDIPWKLAATNQPLKLGEPHDATISIFYFEPELESLDSAYPDDRLVYLKFTVTACAPKTTLQSFGSLGQQLLAGTLPIRLMLFDIGVTSKPERIGSSKPYFHSASPLRRTMIESGVIGRQKAEDEKSSIALSKSGSQFVETISTFTPKDVENESVSSTEELQHREVTNSEASTERRELLSHLTRIENVLTLLSAKHLGSPFLQFSLSPRPLSLLLDEEPDLDPEAWYRTLLHHRSSGIEGIQEFVTTVVVPRGEDFCIQTRLRRVCVMDQPPADPKFGYEPLSFGPDEMSQIKNYLFRTYPRGTPIDELDVDLWPQINSKYDDDAKLFVRPTVTGWGPEWVLFNNVIHQDMRCYFRVPYRKTNFTPYRSILYKTAHEVWLEMRKATYAEKLARSPLERGIVLSFDSELKTCLSSPPDGTVGGPLEVADASSTAGQPKLVVFTPKPARVSSSVGGAVSGMSAIQVWDDLENQLKHHMDGLDEALSIPLNFNQPQLIQFALETLKAMNADDPRNMSLSKVAKIVSLDKKILKKIKSSGVCDLRTLAGLVLVATEDPADACFRDREASAQQFLKDNITPDREICIDPDDDGTPEPFDLQPSITGEDAQSLRDAIGDALERSRQQAGGKQYK